MNVGIYIYDNAEVLDFSGPFEVFSTANRISGPTEPFKVFLLAEDTKPVIARGGFSVNPDYALDQHPGIDVLIIAGGVHADQLIKPAVIDWVVKQAERARIVASVCTGAFILAEAELLSGLDVTTHWEDLAELASRYPELRVVEGRRWVDTGRCVTSGGISAGIDMSLHLVSRLGGMALAKLTASQMEFDWP
ncbi:DJ-1/PfpI family protein [Pseudomonas profundi]|uniref:DJ-1/PfpI family protein n=1 Tax=Pseudomonas profundi TaxID=1981513 RepID=UPI001238D032|nr:DJ-1/PfpI family protein [Pseudomonas profundi]